MKKGWLLLLTVALVQCQSPEEEVPADLIPREKFVEIMIDVQLIESIGKQKMLRIDDPRIRITDMYAGTFEKHGVTDSSFTKTYDWYFAHPDEMLAVFDEVILELGELDKKLAPNE